MNIVVLDPAREKLIASLEEVLAALKAGQDDWQWRLLRTFKHYSLSIGVHPKLLTPLEKMLQSTGGDIWHSRMGRGQGRPTMAPGPAMALTVAAAAVTVLKQRGMNVPDAVRAVAGFTGIERKRIRDFRNTINSGTATQVALTEYPGLVALIETWPDLKAPLADLSLFLK